jgi:hypothetical protein
MAGQGEDGVLTEYQLEHPAVADPEQAGANDASEIGRFRNYIRHAF